ncbi:alpha/beta fold hydrolase [Xylanibacillus composti]|uniref:Serine aminopeptidase S33 domain-containing protein n=1 Tax=Xylanibacillus composti TaxID=1572762 RepID=A0A8J4H1Q5_9BACL|nr:alpha/beta fold hydrolase [Xylanibacillus composti]GIQ69328.1 hypothetical protein XYCOK13_21520 [Xylanibacillus composti]
MWKQVRFGSDQTMAGIVEWPDHAGLPATLLVSLPGLGQAMSEKNYFFSNLRKRLAEEGQWCVQFDYRGSGDSEGELRQATIASMVQDAVEVLDEATKEHKPAKVYLAGHALGAVIAQRAALDWEGRTGIPCIPILISPPLAKLPAARDIVPASAYDMLERNGWLDSKELFPGDDYYTLSDFDPQVYAYVTTLGAHLLYLHGQCIGKELLDELDALDPIALYNENVHGVFLLCGEQDEPSWQQARKIERATLAAFRHGTHFYRHPAAMDEAIQAIRDIVIPNGCSKCGKCCCAAARRQTLAERLRAQDKVDWRFPDEFGLSERNMDCLQLSILEVLKWKGESNPIPIFLNAFDCKSEGLLLRRSLPVLHRGWKLIEYPRLDRERMQHLLRSLLDGEGYALVHYKAFHAPFSSYYHKHDVVHWALVIDYDEDYVHMVDDAGSEASFQGCLGKVPNALFFDTLAAAGNGGMAILQQSTSSVEEGGHIAGLLRKSVSQMEAGLASLSAFVDRVAETPAAALAEKLPMLEFDIHYYRRLRELWKTAAERRVIPDELLQDDLPEALHQVCEAWSFVMGVLMKWKRLPQRDFRDKLISLLREAVRAEGRLQQAFARAGEGRA